MYVFLSIKVIKVITIFFVLRYAIFDLPDAFNQMGIDLYGRFEKNDNILPLKKN